MNAISISLTCAATIIAFCCLRMPPAAHATEYYVSPTGDDTGTGNREVLWQSIASASNTLEHHTADWTCSLSRIMIYSAEVLPTCTVARVIDNRPEKVNIMPSFCKQCPQYVQGEVVKQT